MRLLIILLSCLVWSLSTASAQEWDCNNGDTLPQSGMNYCALQDFESADRELNAAWKTLSPKLKQWDADLDAQWKGLAKATLKAQRSWIGFRDAHCDAEAFKYNGGSIQPLIFHSCRAELTRRRTRQIQNFLEY